MAANFTLGVIFALLGGIANNGGALLQKYAINRVPKEDRDENFFKTLIKDPYWLTGLIMVMAVSGVLYMLAQFYIGAALVPGLAAIGLIVLTLGAIKILHERIEFKEILGIIIMILGIFFIGFSALEISDDDMENLSDMLFITRLIIYSAVIVLFWIIFRRTGKQSKSQKTVLLSLGAGVPFSLTNAWMQPFLFWLFALFTGSLQGFDIFMLIISGCIVGFLNIIGIAHVQDAFKVGDASKVSPISQIPQQITPIIIYYIIYRKSSPTSYSIYFIIIGVILVLIAGFLLGKRQGQMEMLEQESKIETKETIENNTNNDKKESMEKKEN